MRVAVAMSGGVDSTVACILLKAKGYSLTGIYMHNWDEVEEQAFCSSEESFHCVQETCSKLDMPCKRVNFVKEYWNYVFNPYLEGIAAGVNLNPDILCNRSIKFGALLDYAKKTGADKMATGHYARVRHMEDGCVQMLKAVDTVKDQTYFLSLISQSALQHTLFPVGHMTKQEVKKVAHDSGFSREARQKESYGLCFVGKRNFSHFLSNYVPEQVGSIVSTNGRILGTHKGHHLHTLGQRAGLAGYSLPHFVIAKCPIKNSITVVQGPTHPLLYTTSFISTHPHWIRGSHDWRDWYYVRLGHQRQLMRAKLRPQNSGMLKVETEAPFRIVSPGQYAVFYNEDECLGASCITSYQDPTHQDI